MKSSISKSPVYGTAGTGKITAAKAPTSKQMQPDVAWSGITGGGRVAPTTSATTGYDLTKDPLTSLLLGSAESGAQGSRAQQQQRINEQLLGIRGQGGTIAQLLQNSANDQRRLADEMAYRGLLTSGVYAGPTRGAGTELQNVYNQSISAEKQKAENLTAPNVLLEQGLRINAQGAVEPIAPGDPIPYTDPVSGETKIVNFDWKLHTAAGRQAYQNALAQALASYTGSRTSL